MAEPENIEQGPAGVEVTVEAVKTMSPAELIADLAERGVVLATDGFRLWSTTKGITPGIAAEIAPLEAEIIAALKMP